MWIAQCHPWNILHFVLTSNFHHILWCCLLVCEVRQGVLFTCSTVVGDISEFDSARFAVFGVENQAKGLLLKKTFHFFSCNTLKIIWKGWTWWHFMKVVLLAS